MLKSERDRRHSPLTDRGTAEALRRRRFYQGCLVTESDALTEAFGRSEKDFKPLRKQSISFSRSKTRKLRYASFIRLMRLCQECSHQKLLITKSNDACRMAEDACRMVEDGSSRNDES